MKKFGLALAAIGALIVLAPAHSEAKKPRGTMPQATVKMEMPADSKALKFDKGKIRARNSIVLDGKPMKGKASKELLILPATGVPGGKLRPRKMKRQKVKIPKNLQISPVK